MNFFGLTGGYSDQFQVPSIIVSSCQVDPDKCIAWAREVGAIHQDGQDNCFVIDLRIDDRRVGPELFTEAALRRTLRSKSASPA